MNVYEKLNAAREEFHALKLTKTGHNKFAGYNYFELGDFLIPAMQVFKKHGLCGTVSFPDKAVMTVRNTEKPDETIIFESPMGSAALKGCHEVQNIGAVETYQRRYLWVAALEIVEHDALDSSEPVKEQPQKRGAVADVLATSPALSGSAKTAIDKLAAQVQSDFAAYGAEGAYGRIEEQGLEDMEKVYLWSILPSSVRNPITKYSRELHKQKESA